MIVMKRLLAFCER